MVPRRRSRASPRAFTPCPFQAHGLVASAPRAACCACSRSWRTPRTACAPTRWPRRSGRARRRRTTCSTRSARRASPSAPAAVLTTSPPRRPASCRRSGRARSPPVWADCSTSSSSARTSGSTSRRRTPGRSSSRSPAAARACRASPGSAPRIGSNAHALALGKVALSLLDAPALDRYIERGLRPYTPHTIVSPEGLRAQLDDIRAGEVAFDREEFDVDFCCLAKPVRRRPRAAPSRPSGCRCPRAASTTERETLAEVLTDVACKASEVLSAARGSSDLGRHRRS